MICNVWVACSARDCSCPGQVVPDSSRNLSAPKKAQSSVYATIPFRGVSRSQGWRSRRLNFCPEPVTTAAAGHYRNFCRRGCPVSSC